MSYENDKKVLRELGKRYAEYAASDRNKNNIARWKAHNDLKATDVMVMVSQLPWVELPGKPDATLCEDKYLANLERNLRKTLYTWENFNTSETLNPFIEYNKAINDSGIGITIEEVLSGDRTKESVLSHHYIDQLSTREDLAKFKMPIITQDREQTAKNTEIVQDIFGDIIATKPVGKMLEFRPWDKLAMFRSITAILMDLMDDPELIHQTMRIYTDIEISTLKQLEKEDLLNPYSTQCHCSGTHSDILPGKDFDPNNIRSTDCWASGMAQLFSSCSPAMLLEFELNYAREYYAHVGLVNYGCCEPLHNSIEDILQIKNIRKISISPWADPIKAAERLSGKGVIMARKPNPAFLASEYGLDEESVRKELRTTIDTCREHNVSCELILKDLSTVQAEPERISRWCDIAAEEIAR